MESLALSPEIQSLKDMLDGISTANQSTLNALGIFSVALLRLTLSPSTVNEFNLVLNAIP